MVASKKRETENVLHGNAIMSASYWPAEHSVLDPLGPAQLMFVVHDCVEVKRDHSARTIQVRWRRFKARRSGACPPPPAEGAQKGPPADEPAESAEQLADDPAEPADSSRDDATRAAMAPLLIATRMAAILDNRRRQRLSAGPPAIRWLATHAALACGPRSVAPRPDFLIGRALASLEE
jgi:hypothetical protein